MAIYVLICFTCSHTLSLWTPYIAQVAFFYFCSNMPMLETNSILLFPYASEKAPNGQKVEVSVTEGEVVGVSPRCALLGKEGSAFKNAGEYEDAIRVYKEKLDIEPVVSLYIYVGLVCAHTLLIFVFKCVTDVILYFA
jgi:hypothetical protein